MRLSRDTKGFLEAIMWFFLVVGGIVILSKVLEAIQNAKIQ